LLLLLTTMGCAGARPPTLPDIAWATAPTVDIVLTDAMIRPALIKLRKDAPVRLVFQNKTGTPNTLILGDFYSTLNLSQSNREPRSVIRLGPGENQELDVVPRKTGEYALITTLSVIDLSGWANGQRSVVDVLPAAR